MTAPVARTNRRGRATAERILTAAREVLAERGLDLTLEDVARAAGTTRVTVHRHVGTRQELLLSLVREATDRIESRLAEILDGDAPFAERLVDAFVYVVTTTRATPDGAAIVLAITEPTGGWGGIDTEGRIMGEVLWFLRPRFEAAARTEPFRAGVDDTLGWLLRQVQAYLLLPLPHDDEDAFRDEVRTFVVPAVLGNPPAPGAEPAS